VVVVETLGIAAPDQRRLLEGQAAGAKILADHLTVQRELRDKGFLAEKAKPIQDLIKARQVVVVVLLAQEDVQAALQVAVAAEV
jgi:hypothetical protein